MSNEIKWNLTELNRSDQLSVVLLYMYLHMYCIIFLVLWVVELVAGRRSILCGMFNGFFPPYFPLFISARGALFSGAWGLVAGLSSLASHWCSLCLGVGCQ